MHKLHEPMFPEIDQQFFHRNGSNKIKFSSISDYPTPAGKGAGCTMNTVRMPGIAYRVTGLPIRLSFKHKHFSQTHPGIYRTVLEPD
ncbi:MAG: hypothetical protein CMI18_11990 [Opitutaceae bacterium]|nr:hypothetical protein [Opitutaceae bacterium]